MMIALFASPLLANMQPLCTDPLCQETTNTPTSKSNKADHATVHHCCSHVSAIDRKIEPSAGLMYVSAYAPLFSFDSDQIGLYQPGPLLEPPSHI